MIEFGIAGKPSVSKTLETGMADLNKMGLDAMELQFGRGSRIKEETLKRISIAAKDNGIKLSAHAPYFINFNSANPETVAKSSQWVLDTVNTARITEAYLVVIHAGRYHVDKPDTTKNISDGIQNVLDVMQDQGDQIYLGLETMGKTSNWGTLDEIKELCSLSKLVVPVIDFAHLHARYGGLYRTQKDYEKTLDEFQEFSPGFLHAHFTGVTYGEKGELKHLPVSEKEPDFIPLAKALKKRSIKTRLICESPLLEKDALQLKEWYSSL